ncbi:MAG TPA: HAD family phosphatase [Solirubrobacterales bacterium]|jgi:HAD superfamily phosphoserine phosphatase-like hydrolase
MTKLHIFDMDGTLLAGSACLELSRRAGHIDTVEEMEERWGRGELGHIEFYELLLPLWAELGEDDIEEVFAGSPWLEGIEDVWRDIDARDERSVVITMSPQFFAEKLLGLGLHEAFGAEVLAGGEVVPEGVLTPEMKVYIATEVLERLGLGSEDTVAYGDSASDVPLFEILDNTVSVNGSESLAEHAALAYRGNDLREAYRLGRLLLDQEAGVR